MFEPCVNNAVLWSTCVVSHVTHHVSLIIHVISVNATPLCSSDALARISDMLVFFPSLSLPCWNARWNGRARVPWSVKDTIDSYHLMLVHIMICTCNKPRSIRRQPEHSDKLHTQDNNTTVRSVRAWLGLETYFVVWAPGRKVYMRYVYVY